MLSNGKPVLMALLVAYRAMASPVDNRYSRLDYLIDAIYAQLNENIVIDDTKPFLWADGVLNDDNIAKLEQEIQALTTQDGISVDTIAEQTAAYIKAKAAADELNLKRAEIQDAAPDSATIKEVVDHAVNNVNSAGGGYNNCPDGSQAKLCCAVM